MNDRSDEVSATLDNDLRRIFWLGWCGAASWANRDDLLADYGSQAYMKLEDEAVAGLRPAAVEAAPKVEDATGKRLQNVIDSASEYAEIEREYFSSLTGYGSLLRITERGDRARERLQAAVAAFADLPAPKKATPAAAPAPVTIEDRSHLIHFEDGMDDEPAAAPAPVGGMDWQPISTAPEGVQLLVYTPDRGDGERWDFDYLEDGAWAYHSDAYENYMMVGGPNAAGPGIVCTGPGPDAPYTHWTRLATPAAAPAPVDGMVLVPREPTQAMIRAGLDCQDADPADGSDTELFYAYKAMISAAPTREATPAEQGDECPECGAPVIDLSSNPSKCIYRYFPQAAPVAAPSGVDDAMVERGLAALLKCRGTCEGEVPVDAEDVRAALTAALAQQTPRMGGEDRP